MGKPGNLLQEFAYKALRLKNRFVMAPMTRSVSHLGSPTKEVVNYYKRRAENGVGMIITEGAVIDDAGATADPNVPRFYGKQPIQGWKEVVEEVHRAGGLIVPQIWHMGGMLPVGGVSPVSPSGVKADGMPVGEPATLAHIAELIDAFARAGRTAMDLGFDGIEIHGAHGYLIDQFLWGVTNRRTDRYGQNQRNRLRFAVDIVKELRSRVGAGFPIIFRFSQWKVQDFGARTFETPADLESALGGLVDAGVDIFHCSTRRFWEPAFAGSSRTLAGWTKSLSGCPTIAVGSVGLDTEFLSSLLDGAGAAVVGLDAADRLVGEGEADLIAVGRALLADPTWVSKIENGEPAIPFSAESLKTLS